MLNKTSVDLTNSFLCITLLESSNCNEIKWMLLWHKVSFLVVLRNVSLRSELNWKSRLTHDCDTVFCLATPFVGSLKLAKHRLSEINRYHSEMYQGTSTIFRPQLCFFIHWFSFLSLFWETFDKNQRPGVIAISQHQHWHLAAGN